jgi:hypothetical protein
VAAVVNNDTSAQEAEWRTIRSILDQGKTTTTLGKVNNDKGMQFICLHVLVFSIYHAIFEFC